MTTKMFKAGDIIGQDLKAIDHQRERDHGIASYNDFREWAGYPRATSFNGFADLIDHQNIEILKGLYAHPDDVDLGVGGNLERFVTGANAGPIFLKILLLQFRKTRISDRYFYTNGNQSGSFTRGQLKEIKKANVARLICDNTEIKMLQPHAFWNISPRNPLLSCTNHEDIPIIDLSAWKDNEN